MISTNIWTRLKSQADSAFSVVNKSLQESTTNVFSSLAKTNFSDNNEINASNATDNKISSNGIWNSLLTNVKSANQINSVDESTTKKHKSKNLEEYFQVFYKNQIEDKEFTKWDLNVIYLYNYFYYLKC
jgi:predicted Zn-dependent protease